MARRSDLPHLHPVDVERAFMSAMVVAPGHLTDAAARLRPEDLDVHPLNIVYAQMLSNHAQGLPNDIVALASIAGMPDLEWFHALQNEAGSISRYGDYVEIILEASRRRSAAELGSLIATEISAGLLTSAEAIARYREIGDHEALKGAGGKLAHEPGIDLFDEEDGESEWLIEGVVARGWRVILAGSPGIGKMTLLRQIGVCAAAGMNPFQPQRSQEPLKVLVVDVETPRQTVREQIRLISNKREVVAQAGENFQQSLLRSLDLVNSPTDRLRLEHLIAEVRPQLLIIGPLYKLCPHSPNGSYDAEAMTVIGFLDRIRDRYDVAMLLEQHVVADKTGSVMKNTAHAGSEQFIRWADMAVSMVEDLESDGGGQTVKLAQQRGVRGLHNWPQRMNRRPGGQFYTGLCWQSAYER